MFIYEETNNLVSGAFLKFFSICSCATVQLICASVFTFANKTDFLMTQLIGHCGHGIG